MSTYPVDIKAKQITSTAANQEVFGGPGRFLGFSANCTAGAGTITLENNNTALAVFGTPDGSSSHFVYNATFPGTGIKADTKLTVSLSTIADVTFYFG